MAALSTCDEELLWTLLDFKADVNLCDGLEDMNALGLAILLNEVSLVEMLLKHGGKVWLLSFPLAQVYPESVELSKALVEFLQSRVDRAEQGFGRVSSVQSR